MSVSSETKRFISSSSPFTAIGNQKLFSRKIEIASLFASPISNDVILVTSFSQGIFK
jgi:hypothetical protein